jgi:hypothetical protein
MASLVLIVISPQTCASDSAKLSQKVIVLNAALGETPTALEGGTSCFEEGNPLSLEHQARPSGTVRSVGVEPRSRSKAMC